MTSPKRIGRPRDRGVDERLLVAMRGLMGEVGYHGVTVDDVAARAGVGKAAIYRRYGSKAEIAFAAAIHTQRIEPPADTGSLRADLRALAHLIRGRLTNPLALEIAPALIAEFARDRATIDRFRQTFLKAELDDVATLLARAVDRGELARPVDTGLVHLLLVGPLFAAAYGYHSEIDDQFLDGMVDVLIDGMAGAAEERRH